MMRRVSSGMLGGICRVVHLLYLGHQARSHCLHSSFATVHRRMAAFGVDLTWDLVDLTSGRNWNFFGAVVRIEWVLGRWLCWGDLALVVSQALVTGQGNTWMSFCGGL